jgi:hypothetical protein
MTMHRLTTRIKRLESQSGVNGRFVFLPLPGHEGQFMRLPRPFAEWMAKVGQDDRPINYTDGNKTDDDDGIRQNPTE